MNIYDVARRAKVSTATVSRVLNGNSSVNEKTKNRVLKVMEELNYMPSQIAVGLATNSTKTIGVMLPDVRDIFHATVAFLIESKMSKRGYNCILCNTSEESAKEVKYLNSLYGKKVDGIILVGSSYHKAEIDDVYNQWSSKIPLVLINAISADGTASVICDETDGMMQALTHLKERGKKHSIFIRETSDHQKRSSVIKADGFIKACKEVFDQDQAKVYSCQPNSADYGRLIDKISQDKVDSVLFTNDMSCAIFLKSMEAKGLKAPDDLALIGFNNSSISEITTPTLTTIDHHVDEHCEMAVEKIYQMIKGKEVDKVTYIKPTLVIKETT